MARIKSFFVTRGKGLSLLLTMLVGMVFPQAHTFSFLIQYLLMLMLFFAFLDIEFKPQSFQKSVLWVLLANVAVAFIGYLALVSFDLTLALAAFMTAIAPTAIAAPVIIGFIQRDVEYVVTAVVLTNIVSAVIVPLALPSLLGAAVQISVWEVLQACAGRHVRAVDPGAACCPYTSQRAKFYSQRESLFVSHLAGQSFHHQRQRVRFSAQWEH